MKKTINVTNKNILQGEKTNPQNCAIARAIKGNIKEKIKNISVLPSHVTLETNKKHLIAEMPKEGIDFIKRFDRGLAVAAFKLKLNFKEGYSLTS
jgi:hypothetical protein